MKGFRLNLLGVGAILAAYLVTGILNPKSLHGQEFFLKLNNSLSVRNERSIGLDERPFWTSHKHLTSSEKSSGDHILRTTEPWSSVTASERFVAILAVFFPIPIPLFPPNALRAPPLS
jgi:hypothetical protein